MLLRGFEDKIARFLDAKYTASVRCRDTEQARGRELGVTEAKEE